MTNTYHNEIVQLDDELPATAVLTTIVKQCECCGKRNLKRTVCLDLPGGATIYLGVICAGRWFNVTMSGNPWYAIDRLNKRLRELQNSKIQDILDEIKESADNV